MAGISIEHVSKGITTALHLIYKSINLQKRSVRSVILSRAPYAYCQPRIVDFDIVVMGTVSGSMFTDSDITVLSLPTC